MNINEQLAALGWNKEWESYVTQDSRWIPARVSKEHKNSYEVHTGAQTLLAELTGRYYYRSIKREDLPAVGDWVLIQQQEGEKRAMIHEVLPRMSSFSRKKAGREIELQIVAANLTKVFLVMSLNDDYNLRRLERYLITAWESGASPVVVLSKSDLVDDPESLKAEAESVAIGVPVILWSAKSSVGLESLQALIRKEDTVALLGSSGVGKSTLLNAIAKQEHMLTRAIREADHKGKHTTTHRELIVLAQGGVLIDTPGMRELQLWQASEGIQTGFQDIETIIQQCRFRDCQHVSEPGCAIRAALNNHELDEERWHSYVKLQKELSFIARKQDKRLQNEEKRKWKAIRKQQKRNK